VKGQGVARTPTARQRTLVEEGAKGVADRWLGDPGQAAQDGARMRSAVKRFSGKPEQSGAQPDLAAKTRTKATRAGQAAAGMMGPPPATFDEGAIKDWLGRMSAEDLAKLARLTAIAKGAKGQAGRPAWNKVDQGIAQRGLHVEVHGGTVNIDNSRGSMGSAQPKRGQGLGRHFSRLKDFING